MPKTTQSHPHLRRSENLLLEAKNLLTAPNQVIVGDITYLPNQEACYEKWLYLATFLDLKSHRIVGWHLDRHMEEGLVITALQKVIRSRQPAKGLIVHRSGDPVRWWRAIRFHRFQGLTQDPSVPAEYDP